MNRTEKQTELLQEFFDREDIKKLLLDSNFREIFDKFRAFASEANSKITDKSDKLNMRNIIQLLDDANVDWIHNTDIIPSYAFRFRYDIESITIPTNIEEIGDLIIASSSIADVYYEGTKKDFSELQKDRSSFWNGDLENGVIVHCTDGDI